jgi:hypothetical protein
VQTLLRGLCKRLANADAIKHGEFLALDPIKQDFVMRESFRRAIVNDCLVVFEDESSRDGPTELLEKLESFDLDDEVLPSDSASQFGSRPTGAHSNIRTKPHGADSVIGPVEDEHLGSKDVSVVGPLDQPVASVISKGRDVKSVLGSVYGGSVAPKVSTAFNDGKSVISRSSAATGITSTSFRKPFNVRTVQLMPE